uniref:Uncharacterized protein n=1 Tax=Anguilla anguilla TaxID=7936 RepID=A0A0E9STH4_ANGAN
MPFETLAQNHQLRGGIRTESNLVILQMHFYLNEAIHFNFRSPDTVRKVCLC